MKKISKIICVVIFIVSYEANSQYGTLDETFDTGVGADDLINSIAMQSDNKVIFAGNFLNYGGTTKKRIMRVLHDGSSDISFNPGSGANNDIMVALVQPDDKILIGGLFTAFNNVSRKRIARLHSDGSLDTGFAIGLGANEDIHSMAIQNDGKILIGGIFSSFNWASANRIARLNANGSLDTSFICTIEIDGVSDIIIQPDGKLVINAVTKIIRLNSDGSLDDTFSLGIGADFPIHALVVQEDGKMLVGGFFTYYNGTAQNRLLRLNPDGSIDDTFSSGEGANYGILTISEQPDKQLIISGIFTTYDLQNCEKVARLDPDGTKDQTFNTLAGPNNIVLHHYVQPDGKVLVSGAFTSFGGATRNRIARINGYNELRVNAFTTKSELHIYPNPAEDLLHIKTDGGELISAVQIKNMSGKVVLDLLGNQNKINVEQFASGLYLLSVETDRQTHNIKFVKQ